MPDQNSAADEHALLEEITAPLERLPENAVAPAPQTDFPLVLRGYDRFAVDEYVRRTSRLVADLQASSSPTAAVRRAVEQVGEQVSGILQRAHDTAAQITTQSRSEAEDRLEVARTEADDRLEVARTEATLLVADAEQRLRELDVETDRIWGERRRIVEDARQLAQELLRLADAAVERFPAAGDTGEEAVAPAPELIVEDPAQDPDLEGTIAIAPVSAADAAAQEPDLEQTRTFDPLAPEATGEHEPTEKHEPPQEREPTEEHESGGPAGAPRDP